MIRETIFAVAKNFNKRVTLLCLVGLLATGCLNSSSKSAGGASTGSASGSTGAASTSKKGLGDAVIPGVTNSEAQCKIFANNTRDYNACLGCKLTLCPCQNHDPSRPTLCLDTAKDLSSCTVDSNQLVQCVHDNLAAAGGPCIGLKCGDGQIADFTSCLCRDSTPPSSIGAAPGREDLSTPYMEPGFFVSDRICGPADVNTAIKDECLLENHLDTPPAPPAVEANFNFPGRNIDLGVPSSGTAPTYLPQTPANVFPDVGYLRWDVSLDASQYGPAHAFQQDLPFLGTWATFPISYSMSYQLKPDTILNNPALNCATNSDVIDFVDCVENFSGFGLPTGSIGLSSNLSCSRAANVSGARTRRDANSTPANCAFGGVPINKINDFTGTALLENVSVNGTASNRHMIRFDLPGNKAMQPNTGLANRDDPTLAGNIDGTTSNLKATGLFSNIGYYKYTWGPLKVKRPPSTTGGLSTDIASATVTGRVALNVNLGFTPGSVVESSAASPLALLNNVPSRDCSVSTQPFSCVSTAVFRTPGGGVLSQSFSPEFARNHDASGIMALPSGITAVSTPKIVEDTSQLSLSLTRQHIPARLRTFVRGADGNIYMSRFEGARWFPWMSLGRPWMCDPASPVCTDLNPVTGGNGPATLYPVYAPILVGSTDVNKAPPTTPNSNPQATIGYDTTNISNGISIASEPVVASLMIHNDLYANIGGPAGGAPLTLSKVQIGAGGAFNCLATEYEIQFSTGEVDKVLSPIGPMNKNLVFSNFAIANLNGQQAAATMRVIAGNAGLTVPAKLCLLPPSGLTAFSGTGLTSNVMITRQDPATVDRGMIGIFVRVSQVNSTNGLIGPLHNSIWYTMTKTGHPIVDGDAWDFDLPQNWTNWMMVETSKTGDAQAYDANGTPRRVRLQGNPLVLIDNSVGFETLHVLGTSAYSDSSVDDQTASVNAWAASGTGGAAAVTNTMMHPPIAPTSARADGSLGGASENPWQNDGQKTNRLEFDGHTYINASGSARSTKMKIKKNWHNYGMMITRTSLPTSGMADTRNWERSNGTQAGLPGSPAQVFLNMPRGNLGYTWSKAQHNMASAMVNNRNYSGGIVSDWSYAVVNNSAGPSIRVMAMDLRQHMNPCMDLEPVTAVAASTNVNYSKRPNQPLLAAPCKYERAMSWLEYNFHILPIAAPNGNESGRLDFQCQGAYNAVDFIGTPHAINISASTSAANVSTFPGSAVGKVLLFGRAICKDKSKCDTVNPQVSFATASEQAHCEGLAAGVRALWGDSPEIGAATYDPLGTHPGGPNPFGPIPPHTMYHPGEAFFWDGIPAAGVLHKRPSQTMLQLPVSADVVPIFSNALRFKNNDASLYFITRDSSGNSSHGLWEGFTDPSASGSTPLGNPSFTIFSSGPFTN